MNIQKATTAAMAINGYLFRASWRSEFRLEPTNGMGCIVAHSCCSKEPCPRWEPFADDLIAEDWEISEDLSGMDSITTEGG